MLISEVIVFVEVEEIAMTLTFSLMTDDGAVMRDNLHRYESWHHNRGVSPNGISQLMINEYNPRMY